MSIENIAFEHDIRVRIECDEDPESPASWDNLGKIAYYSGARYVLGTEAVSRDRLDEIRDGIENGVLVGLPVFAYIHGVVTITAAESNPFQCPWDSGQSGFVYCTRGDAIKEFGKKQLTKSVRERALKCLVDEVETFNQYLNGNVYGYIVERVTSDDVEELEACWGYYGLDCAVEEGKAVAAHYVKKAAEEIVEAAYWASRDVATEETA